MALVTNGNWVGTFCMAMWLAAGPARADVPRAGPAELAGRQPVAVVFDSDMDSDCDDAGALALLHTLADQGEATILAVMISSLGPHGPSCADAINTYRGRPDLPIGAARAPAPNQPSKYARGVAERFPHDLRPGQAPDAVELYRTTLAAQPDDSVTVVTVGDMTNLAKLIRSPAGGGLPAGRDLVRRKVKLWVCMGGNFVGSPARDDLKKESNNNFTLDPRATYAAITEWPTPIVFAGREVCSVPSGLRAGKALARTPADNPVRAAYELYFGGEVKDRHVADQVTVLFAVRGLREDWDAHGVGSMELSEDMTFTWNDAGERPQAYLKKRKRDGKPNDRAIEKLVDDLMATPPARK